MYLGTGAWQGISSSPVDSAQLLFSCMGAPVEQNSTKTGCSIFPRPLGVWVLVSLEINLYLELVGIVINLGQIGEPGPKLEFPKLEF